MIIVDNKIINQYTHIEIFFNRADNNLKVLQLYDLIKELTNRLKEIFKQYSIYNKEDFLSLCTKDKNNLVIFDKKIHSLKKYLVNSNTNLTSDESSKFELINLELKEKYKLYDSLINELSETCYAIFWNNETLIAKTNNFENKEKLFDWLHDNEIVPSNSFKELEIKGSL